MKKLFIILIMLLVPSFSLAKVLEWPKNETASYYLVYWGSTPGDYTDSSVQIPKETTKFVIPNNLEGNYYFTVKGFNKCGNSTKYSNEVLIENLCPPVKEMGSCFIKEIEDK